jgi:hypothetical protein
MKFRPDKVTVLEADAILREYVASILTDAGYQVFAEPAAERTMPAVWAEYPMSLCKN